MKLDHSVNNFRQLSFPRGFNHHIPFLWFTNKDQAAIFLPSYIAQLQVSFTNAANLLWSVQWSNLSGSRRSEILLLPKQGSEIEELSLMLVRYGSANPISQLMAFLLSSADLTLWASLFTRYFFNFFEYLFPLTWLEKTSSSVPVVLFLQYR